MSARIRALLGLAGTGCFLFAWQIPLEWRGRAVAEVPGGALADRSAVGDEVLLHRAAAPDKTRIRIKFHIFGDGNTYASTPSRIARQVQRLNNEFAPKNIEFVAQQLIFITDTRFFDFCGAQAQFACFCDDACRSASCNSEESALKTQYAENPAEQLNVYVVNLAANTGFAGLGYSPRCAEATAAMGGILIDGAHVGGVSDQTDERDMVQYTTLTREISRTLGLHYARRRVNVERTTNQP